MMLGMNLTPGMERPCSQLIHVHSLTSTSAAACFWYKSRSNRRAFRWSAKVLSSFGYGDGLGADSVILQNGKKATRP